MPHCGHVVGCLYGAPRPRKARKVKSAKLVTNWRQEVPEEKVDEDEEDKAAAAEKTLPARLARGKRQIFFRAAESKKVEGCKGGVGKADAGEVPAAGKDEAAEDGRRGSLPPPSLRHS